MKVDIKIISVLLIVAIHLMQVDGWGVRVRFRAPVFRKVGRVVRKAGQGIKTGVRKVGNGIKTGVRKAGKGIKTGIRKTGEGLEKAGKFTGKHLSKAAKTLHKGLRETGKALITASNFVGDILEKINLVKFIWKKLGACCIPIPSLCRAKRQFESVQRRLKYLNKAIDRKWNKVEHVFQWLGKLNENIEDIAYHVDRITFGTESSVFAISPSLFNQYNTKMNSIKQDVKWKNSSVIHLTRQGVTTFVAIEMAWQCPKVASSVKSGLRKLREAENKCTSIMRESNGLLRFLNQGWNQIKAKLSSAKLKTRLNEVRALCQDSQHSQCVSSVDKFLSQISRADYGKAFELQEDLITALAAMKYSYVCLQRKKQVLSTVSEYCRKGNENFHSVYLQAVRDFFPNADLCTGLVSKEYTTRDFVWKQLQIEAKKKGFYSKCSLNRNEIITKTCLNYSTLAISYNLPPEEKSRLYEDCKKIVPALGKLSCVSQPCENGGTCIVGQNSYTCNCPKGFHGRRCEAVVATGPPFETIGCFQDYGIRAIPTIEGQDTLLDGSYSARKNAIEKCYRAAKKRGFQVFAVQDGGWCSTSGLAARTFDMYGKSPACKPDGKGGPWANQVYYIKEYGTVGCYKDTSNRAIPTLEGNDPILDGPYRSRQHAIAKCALAAIRVGYKLFALQHGGWCTATASDTDTFKKYGKSSACKPDGEGGPWANQVYLLKELPIPYETIGCFQDRGARAIPTIEGYDRLLDGPYKARKTAIEKCYRAAKERGFKVFAIQDGGWCVTSATAEKTFDKYGRSSSCKPDGRGGPWANQVYYIKDYKRIGCYKDTSQRAIQTLEGHDRILDGQYWLRKHAIAKCAVAARRAGYTMFAVQNGGWCAASRTARSTFKKYGKSSACRSDGEGGPLANEVYVL